MTRFGGADESVIRAVEPLHHGLKPGYRARNQFLRRQLLPVGRLQHFDAVLIRPGKKEYVVAVEPHEARDGIGGDLLVGVADVRWTVWIVDRRRDVIFGFVGHDEAETY